MIKVIRARTRFGLVGNALEPVEGLAVVNNG